MFTSFFQSIVSTTSTTSDNSSSKSAVKKSPEKSKTREHETLAEFVERTADRLVLPDSEGFLRPSADVLVDDLKFARPNTVTKT